ncbi:MAG: FecR family protein [Bacteroidota bacterium]
MNKEEYLLLYEKVLAGKCTPQEEQQLLTYLDDFELQDLPWDAEQMGDKQQTRDTIYRQLHPHINSEQQIRIKPSYSIIRWMAAAVALLGISFVAYMLYHQPVVQQPALVKTQQPKPLKNDALPGGNKAILTLANGARIILDSARKGKLAQQGNTVIGKTANGQIVYDATKMPATPANNPDAIALNTITTPRGGQYNITLADGTRVWLNAASSLTFPASFTGKERAVTLTGEAYFEVAKNKEMPFKVQVNKMVVQVLGTHFNVMAYTDERKMVTTLLEGSVKINNGAREAVLKPGQQAIAAENDNYLKVQQANLEEAIAWKNGYFLFDNENIQSIMRKVSRWYNVDITYTGNMQNKDFDGTVSRFKNVTEVLKMLELTGAIHFKVEEGRIIVMP